jgi:YD repeat-containing protein
MKKIAFSIISCFILQTALTQSEQTLNKVVIVPPTAAALVKYADIPVNYHTGIPQIGVPIYTLKEGSLEVPISLSYHSGGIKLDEQASWVGLGWSLNAGGVITRTVLGTPDENGTAEYMKNGKSHLSLNGYNNYYFHSDPSSPLATHDVTWFNEISDGIADGEPDLFFFNFNGYSGKFYFNDDGRPVMVPESDYKIDYVFTSGQYSIQKFIITTPDGTKYYFGVTDNTSDVDPIEKTHNFYTGEDLIFYTGTNNTIASWYLNKIVSADNQFTITLNYTAEEYGYTTVQGKTYKSGEYAGSANGHAKYYGHWVQGVRLSSIASPNMTIYFDPGSAREDLNIKESAGSMVDVVNTDAKTLGAVRIVNNLGDCKKFLFSYSYFVSDPTGLPAGQSSGNSFTDLKRLKLTEVSEQKCDGTGTLTPYHFDYYTEALPRRLSFAKDHWGFMNGKTTNDRLIPTFYEKLGSSNMFNEIPGADREAYWPAMRAGSLKKITYPTGGFTEFEFEANTTYLNYTQFNKVLAFSMYAGVYGQANPTIQTRSFNNAGYTVKLTNWPTGGAAALEGIPGLTIGASAGQTVYNQTVVNAGTYQLSLYKLDAITGNGVSADVYEWVPTNIQENRIVGGLRIKTITHSDGTNSTPNIVTNYDYNLPNTQSSGHLYSRPTYVQIVRNDWLRDVGIYMYSPSSTPHCSIYGYEICNGDAYLISPNSTRPMQTTQGNHLGYNEVKVSQTNNGYKIYRYYGSNVWDDIYNDVADRVVELQLPQSNDLPSFPSTPPKTDFKRGELKYEAVYNQAVQLLSETWYYPEYTENSLKTPALLTGSGTVNMILPAFYDVVTAKKTKLTIQSRKFQPGVGYLENTVENFFNSNQHTQLSKKIETNSKGETIESNYKYASDYKPDGCLEISDGSSTYSTSCTTCQSQYLQDRATSGHNTAYWNYWDYQKLLKCLSEARKAFFAARKNYFNPSVSGSFANCLANAKTNALTDLKPLFELQDRFINTPIEVFAKKNNKLIGATFSKYVYGTAPADMVYINAIQKINLASPSASFTNSIISGNNLIKDSRYLDEASITINNGNVSQSVAKDGIITSYIWGYNNTLAIVKAINVDYATLLSAYNAVSGNLNLIRSQPSLSNALLNTYEYKPGVGIIKETDARGRNINYEYDALNRLTLVRDHDNNIVKKICYNYTGQPENCSAYANVQKSENFIRNNCSAGGTGASVTYTVPANTYFSYTSQAEADAKAQSDVDNNGQAYANNIGNCVFYNVQKSGNFTRNNCAAGGTPSTVTYTVAAGTYSSSTSQAAADQLAQNNVNANGQTYANNNGTCTFYNVQKSGSFTRNNCAAGATPGTVTYTVAAGIYSSTASQAAADQLAQNDVNSNGQTYANNNGICTFYNVQKNGYFTKNNCPAGASPNTVNYVVAAGTYNSIVSQAAADQLAQNDVNANGQTYANNNGTCTFYSVLKSGNFIKNNCPAGTTGSTVTYTVPAGQYGSTISQAAADQLAQNDVNANGQNYANANGSCSNPSFSLDYSNLTGEEQYIMLTNTSTSEFFSFYVPANSSGNLGYIPEGNYDIQIWDPGYMFNTYYAGCGYSTGGYGCNFYNIPLNSTCHYISITPNW